MYQRTMARFAAVISLVVWTCQAAGPAFWDDFDSYPVGQTFVNPINGWQASSNAVVVSSTASYSQPNSVMVPRYAVLTNTVNGGGDKVIWTDLYWKPVAGEQPSDLPLDTASLVAYCNASGYVQVATSAGWVTCSNDVWGGAIAPAGSDFVRVTIYQNYSASNAALFVDGRLAAQDLRFVGSANAYHTFTMLSPSSNLWVDNVWIKTNYDAATLTNDFNGNGVADAAELATYGYAARTQYVGIGYGTFQAALNAWRPRDTVYVFSGNYAEDLVVSNAAAFGGNAFTNSGTLVVKAGASPAFLDRMVWGTVDVDTNAVVTFDQTLECSNLVVRAGATMTCQAVVCSNLIVETGARLTCLGTFSCANAGSFASSSVGVFSNRVSCPGIATVASSATVMLGQGGNLGTLRCTGSVAVADGQWLTVGTAVVPGVVYVTGGGTATVTTALSMPVGGHMEFAQSRFQWSPLLVDLAGTFSISNDWGAGNSVWVSANANGRFSQALGVDVLTVYAGATSVFEAVSCTNLVAGDGARLTFLETVQSVNSAVFGADGVVGFSNLVTCGNSVTIGTNTVANFGELLSCSSLVIRAGATVTCQSVVCSNLVVEEGARFTCLGSFQCYGACSIGSNAVADFSGTVSCANGFTVASGGTVTLSQGGTVGAVDVAGTVIVGAGKTLTTGTAAVSGGMQVSGSGTIWVNGTLNVTGSGLLTFDNSRLVVSSSSVDMSGTFTVDNKWGNDLASLPLPFNDDFERYWNGAKITELGFAGWGASVTSVVVQSSIANTAVGGNKALSIPASAVVSNHITTMARKIWTDCYVRPTLGGAPFWPSTNTAGFVAFADSNGWLEVATSNGWDVCSNLVSGGGQPDRMTTSSWTRVTVCQNLASNTVAVFINGKLVRQLMRAPGAPMAAYTSFAFENTDGQAYLDDVSIKETWPVTITADLDRDLVVDADEVDRIGSMTARNDWVSGAIYILR